MAEVLEYIGVDYKPKENISRQTENTNTAQSWQRRRG